MGDGETFEEILLRADLLPRFIEREIERGEDVTAARAMLVWADARIRGELRRGWERMMGGGGAPSEDPQPSILDHVRMGEWEAASELAKDALGLPDTVRVFIVPESAVVTIDGVVVS